MNFKRTANFVAAVLVAFAVFGGSSQAAKLDPDFGDGGVSVVGEGFPKQGARGLTIDSSGRLLVTGRGGDSGNQIYVGRVLGNGHPDPSFATNGYALYDGSVSVGSIYGVTGRDLSVRRDGKIGVAGTDEFGLGAGSGHALVAGFNGDGMVDSGWGVDGLIVNYHANEAKAIGQDWRGRLLVAGDSNYGEVLRYSPTGRPDRSFVGDGRTHTKQRGQVQVREGRSYSVILNDVVSLGKRGMLVAGVSNGRFMIAKLNNKGGYDNTFGSRGITMIDVEPGENHPYNRTCGNCTAMVAMALTKGGKIVMVGSSPYGELRDRQRLILTRFNRDGHIDRTFGRRGIKIFFRGQHAAVKDMAIQRDGKIVIVGGSLVNPDGNYAHFVMRLTSSGRFDRSFFGNGIYKLEGLASPNSVLVDHAGRIVVAGGSYTETYFSDYPSYLLRILPNAS